MARLDPEIAELAAKFVCVRIIHMGGVDLDLFQFDGDMTWAAFFMNADKTIYGRYGSRKARGAASSDLLSMPSLKTAMRRALTVHADYPANKEALKEKRGPPLPWKRPERIPMLAEHARRARPPVTCIHCHHIPGGATRSLIEAGKLLRDDQVWVYPLPDSIGLSIDVNGGLRVERVRAGSAAEKAGIEPDDVVDRINGQPILSIADIQWVLHRSPRKTELKFEVLRKGRRERRTVSLDGPWKEMDISWRSTAWQMRPGLKLVALTGAERARAGLPDATLALRVARLFPNHPSKQRGFRRNDVIFEVAGRTDPMTESRFLAFLRQHYKAGSRVPVRVLRKGVRIRKVLKLG